MDKFIEINNITFEYSNGRRVIENFSLNINSEEFTFITGKNGSGKTTLTKLIMGILKPQSGEIYIYGKSIRGLSLGQIGQDVGYVFQFPERQLFATSVIEELTFPLLLKGERKGDIFERAEELIRLFELENIRASYPGLLSYGEKRRLAIAAVLMNNPKYLILDEPTASLDNDRIEILQKTLFKLKERKVGLLAISHNKSFIDNLAQRVINLEGGKITGDEKKQYRSTY
jgi:energy-coupling factor transport system ATP-binding protein